MGVVEVTENGRSKTMPAVDAILLQHRNAALKGDRHAIREVLRLQQLLELPEEATEARVLHERDAAVMNNLFKRMQQMTKTSNDETKGKRVMDLKLSLDEMDALYRSDLQVFVERVLYELQPETKYSDSPHITNLCSKLTECINGGSRRVIINLPPRSLKSIIVSVALVAWLLGKNPSEKSSAPAMGRIWRTSTAGTTRSIMSSDFYRRVFPGTRLSANKQAVNDFETTMGGGRMATSVGGVLTGRGANTIIIDDPQKPDEALSEPRRRAANDWLDNTALSRLDNKETGIVIIVMQRLHQDDLVGHVLEQGDWDVLSFPAIAEQDEIHTAQTPYGPFRFERKKGEVLDPIRESLQTLLAIKQNIGSYNFENQYQQNPMSLEGMMVRHEWLRYYDPLAPLPRFTTKVQSWDTANKSGELNDFSVGTTWG